MLKRILTGVAIASLVAFAASCSSSTTNSNANVATTTTTAPDNSEIRTTNENGVKTETRTFKNNPRISKVVVTTRDGKKTVKVYSPSGEEREVKSDPEKALSATGEAIADSAGFVKDKSTEVGEKTVDVSKDVVDKTKEGTKDVADKTKSGTEKVINKSVDTTKTVANKTKDTGKTVVNKTAEGAKKTGNALKKVIP